ncbi:unnamed protein product [Absidia cylindrospora]
MTRYGVGDHVRTLDMKRKHRWTDAQLLVLMIHLPHLEHLYVRKGQEITDKSFQHLPRYCPHLRSILVHKARITQTSILKLGDYCDQLNSLSIQSCPRLPAMTFSGVLGRCPITQLSLGFDSFMHADEDEDCEWITYKETVQTMTYFFDLTHLTVTGVSFDVMEGLLAKTGAAWASLTHLTLDQLDSRCDDDLMTFFKQHTRLQQVTLHGNGFGNRTLDAMWRLLPQLTYVDIGYNEMICVHGLRRMIWHCPRLHHVELVGCDMSPNDFPEASKSCWAVKDPLPGYPVVLSHIDQSTIQQIQRGPDPGEHD